MSEHAKPTPGPWRVQQSEAPDVLYIVGTRAEDPEPWNRVIAKVLNADTEAETDARLMAASYLLPEVREALAVITSIAEALNNQQHAGIRTSPEQWSRLYQETPGARDLLARLGEALGRRDA